MDAAEPLREQPRNQPLWALLIFGALSVAVLLSVPWDADPGWWDASRHAMDGAFYLDFLRSGRLSAPVEYAQDYYARFPAIAPVIYPPLFGLVEAAFFVPFGPHPWVGRLVVVLFLLWGAWGVRRIACDMHGPLAGLASGGLYIVLPLVFTWSREIMLESSAAAFIIWAFATCRRFLDQGRTRDLAFCLACAVLSVYTKQNSIFVFPAILLTIALSGRARVLQEPRVWIGVACAAVAGIPLAYVSLRWGRMNFDQAIGNLPMEERSFLDHALYHILHLPETVGWPVLLLALPGAIQLARGRRLNLSLAGVWMATCYAIMAIVRLKEARHGFFWMPPFALLGGLGLASVARAVPQPRWRPAFAALAAAALMAVQIAHAPMNWCEGFARAARDIRDRWEGAALLVSVEHDGNLIFRLRALDPDLRLRIYRSEKIFEKTFVHKSWGVVANISTEQEVYDAMRRFGMRYALVEEEIQLPTYVEDLLRKCVRSDQFRLATTYEVRYPGDQPRRLGLYRFLGPIDDPPASPTIHLPIVGMQFK